MKTIFQSIRVYIALSVLVGIFYTGALTGIAHFAFPAQARGSLIRRNNGIIGSALIGQSFADSRYFQSRPSAVLYNPLPSGASNLAVTGIQLKDSVEQRRKAFHKIFGLLESIPVPAEMLFSSASGLDPHICPASARMQAKRVAFERHFAPNREKALDSLVERSIKRPQWGFLGQSRINVLELNLSVDSLEKIK